MKKRFHFFSDETCKYKKHLASDAQMRVRVGYLWDNPQLIHFSALERCAEDEIRENYLSAAFCNVRYDSKQA